MRVVSQETTGNSSVYVWKPPQQQLSSSKRPRKSSSPSSSKKKSKESRKTQEVGSVAVVVVEQQQQPPPSRPPAPPARPSPCDALVQASKKFLGDQALSTGAAQIYYNVLHQYLEGLPGSSGSIGLFLLSGRTLDMFAQVRRHPQTFAHEKMPADIISIIIPAVCPSQAHRVDGAQDPLQHRSR